MSQVIFKRGTSQELKNQALQDGLLSFTTDDGRIHLDYIDESGVLVRKTFYSGKLKFGDYTYDGTSDVDVAVYDGNLQE